MSRLTITSLGFVALESRLTPDAGSMSAMGAMAQTTDPLPDDPAATVTGAVVVRRDGRLWLAVTVDARCPACVLRAAGVIRQVGDGVTEALFPVRSGATSIDVEMSDQSGQLLTVWRVRLGPDGQVIERSVLPVGDPMDMGGMAMGAGGAMGSHAAESGMPVERHGEPVTGHAPRSGPAHAEAGSPHARAAEMGGMGTDGGHRVGLPMSGGRSEDGHPAESDGLDTPPDGHVERMPVGPPAFVVRVEEEDRETPVPEAEPPTSFAVVSPPPDAAEYDDAANDVWPLVAGGAIVTAALVAASHVLERQARRVRVSKRVVIRPPRPRAGRPARPYDDCHERPTAVRSSPCLQPLG
jgi:hypothetical protein